MNLAVIKHEMSITISFVLAVQNNLLFLEQIH